MRRFSLLFLSLTDHKRHKRYEQRERCFRVFRVFRGCFYLFAFILSFLLVSCAQPTDSTDDRAVERERIEVSGSIVEDAVWESGKEYYVTGDVIVEAGATLTLQPDVVVKFAHERADEYVGITVKGTLIADPSLRSRVTFGGDSTTAILFTSDAPEWAKKPGDCRLE